MTAKHYLLRLRKLNERIDCDIERLAEMKLSATCIGSMRYDKEHVQTSPEDKMSRVVTDYVELGGIIDEEIEAYHKLREHIIRQISMMSGQMHKWVLYKHYVEYKPMRQVAAEIGRSVSRSFGIRKEALKAFKEQFIKV